MFYAVILYSEYMYMYIALRLLRGCVTVQERTAANTELNLAEVDAVHVKIR